jgi:hypothetical protein
MATAAQRRLRTRKRKADRAVAKARRAVQALTKKLRNATKVLGKRQATRRKM